MQKQMVPLAVHVNHDHRASHTVFLKEHSVREKTADKPSEKTLFVTNIPPYCDEECLRRLFSEFGKVESVQLQHTVSNAPPKKEVSRFFPTEHHKTGGFKVAYIVFKKPSHLRAALNAQDKPRFFVERDNQYLTGMKKWTKSYEDSIVSAEALQAEVDAYMAEYDKQKALREAKEKEGEGEPDDEGWVTVTSKSRTPVIARTAATEDNLKKKERTKAAEKQLVNFYTYQLKQTKIENIAHLRKKFEEDKKRIQEIKQSRKFRPY